MSGTVSMPTNVSTPSKTSMFDRFGFLTQEDKDNGDNPNQQQSRSHDYYNDGLEKSGNAQRVWTKLIQEWQSKPVDKLEEHLKAGVPRNLRGKVWAQILDIGGARQKATFNYEDSLKISIKVRDSRLAEEEENDEKRREWASAFGTPRGKSMKEPKEPLDDDGEYPSAKALKQIQLDLDRTFYNHSLLMVKDGPGQQSLFNVLAVYARANPKVGYCQGMAYIAAVLLMNMPEEEAFWSFHVLMESPRHFSGYFDEKLTRVQHEAAIFEEIVNIEMPQLSAHMQGMCIHPLMYVTPWLMCAFTALPMWDTVLSIWDMMLFKGTVTLTRTALAVMTVNKTELMACDSLGTLLPYLQHIPASKTRRPAFPKAIWKIKPAHLDALIQQAQQRLNMVTAPKRGPSTSSSTSTSTKTRSTAPNPTTPAARRGKRLHSQTEFEPSTPVTAKKARGTVLGIDNTVAPTPNVFRRFMNSLATPLRQRARMDGAETPVSRRIGESKPLNTNSKPKPNTNTNTNANTNTNTDANTNSNTNANTTTSNTEATTIESIAATSSTPKFKKMEDFGCARTPRTPAEMLRTPNRITKALASPYDSPFNHSGFLSPSYSGKVPVALASAVTTLMSPSNYANMSPSVYTTTDGEMHSFASFKEPTPRRTSPVKLSAKKETEMATIKENTNPNSGTPTASAVKAGWVLLKRPAQIAASPMSKQQSNA